ncbi:MAG: dihydroxyacetone kinase subunit L [Verrucomicrobia bacterium]|nr:dihydroxyacetone kinase subunit L [Verrucomicrobiota bacterium]
MPAKGGNLDNLSPSQTKQLLVRALQLLAEQVDQLNELDRALGDGDHGTTVGRGVAAALRELGAMAPTSINEIFVGIGKGMMKSMGGASGVLYGVFFQGAQSAATVVELTSSTLLDLLECGLKDLQAKTKAVSGDKTMLDALIPAIRCLEQSRSKPLPEALRIVAAAAEQGANSTIGLLPKIGRAKTLGHRACVAKDPGATSVAIFFRGLAVASQEPIAS